MATYQQTVRPSLTAFANELRAARIHSGLSRSELARRANMTRQGILKAEQRGNVTLATMVMLAAALGCQVSDFFPHKAPWR
jgi:transcriptional regulator with XRE-family HTH domain